MAITYESVIDCMKRAPKRVTISNGTTTIENFSPTEILAIKKCEDLEAVAKSRNKGIRFCPIGPRNIGCGCPSRRGL